MEIESLEIRNEIAEIKNDLINMWKQIYPVGSIYISASFANPEDWFGGTWEPIKGRFLLGVDPSDETGHWDAAEMTGGREDVTLGINEMPSHQHRLAGAEGATTMAVMTNRTQSNDVDQHGGGSWTYDQVSMFTEHVGGGQPFSIMPPFYTVYMWKRTG